MDTIWHPQRITLEDYVSGHLEKKNPKTNEDVVKHLPCEKCQPTIDEIRSKQAEYDREGIKAHVGAFFRRLRRS